MDTLTEFFLPVGTIKQKNKPMGGNRMKKNLIIALALVFVLGFAGTAFAAANPFVDVPAKHWAYDAVTKLAQAGILDGYGDGTYRGERLATRYEMAQATAKAMARADKADAQMKALIDKLAVEFAAELNNLGVRVAKLEKNASSIKFWGDSRLRFISNPSGLPDGAQLKAGGWTADSYWDQRLRVYAKADLNDKATFYGRIMANWRDTSTYGTSYESSMYWDYGYFEWTLTPEFKVAIGRQQIIAAQDLFWTNGGYDAIQVKFGAPSDKFQAKLGYGDVGTYTSAGTPSTGITTKPVFLADLNYKLNKDWSVNGAMYWSTNADKLNIGATAAKFVADWVANPGKQTLSYVGGYPFQVYNFGVRGQLNEDFNLRANYFWNVAQPVKDFYGDDQHNGWMAELWFRGADKAKVGSWGLAVNYRDIKPFAIDLANVSGLMANSLTNNGGIIAGQKGFGFQANYTISKNAVLTATYEKLSYNSSFYSENILPFYYLQLNVNF